MSEYGEMDNVQFLASVAEILGGVAVVFGISFGFVEFRRYKAKERREAAASLARSFQTPELAATLRLMVELPEPISMQQYRELSDAEKNLIWLLFCSIESIGILVSRGDLPIELVDDFFSIPVIEGWRKLSPYVLELRRETDSPQTWEWYQWLYDRLTEYHKMSPRVPAHVR
jgi:hypothetical protein